MIRRINESKTLTKYIPSECKCKFYGLENVIQIKTGITINVRASTKNVINMKNIYIWNPATCSCKNGTYLASMTDDPVIKCDEIIDAEAKSYDEETKKNSYNKF